MIIKVGETFIECSSCDLTHAAFNGRIKLRHEVISTKRAAEGAYAIISEAVKQRKVTKQTLHQVRMAVAGPIRRCSHLAHKWRSDEVNWHIEDYFAAFGIDWKLLK